MSYALAIVSWVLAAFAGGGGEIITCWDPEGLCADVPCPCEGACLADSHCQEGYVCRQELIGPSTCWCMEDEDGPWWNGTFDFVGRCEPAPVPGPRPYTIIELGTLGGLEAFGGRANNHGQVTGFAGIWSGGRHPFMWENDVLIDLFPDNDEFLTPNDADINDLGQVVFESGERDKGGDVIYLWENGASRRIGLRHWDWDTPSLQINNLGQVLLDQRTIWQDGETIKISDLSDPPLKAKSINNLGHLGGWIEVGVERHAALLIDGETIDLGTFGADEVYVQSVNDLGQATILADDAPFLWNDGQVTDLRELMGLPSLRLGGINNCGEMSGSILVEYPGQYLGT